VARSVIALWNQGCNGRLPAVAHEPASLPRVVKAVQQRGWGLATWAALFDAVHASAWLTGRKPGRDGATFAADFWWVLEHLDEIRSGRYTDRATPDRPHERTVTVAEARAIFGGPS
jgi:hypothetical protein